MRETHEAWLMQLVASGFGWNIQAAHEADAYAAVEATGLNDAERLCHLEGF